MVMNPLRFRWEFYLPRDISVREAEYWTTQETTPRGFELRIKLASPRTFGAPYLRLKEQ